MNAATPTYCASVFKSSITFLQVEHAKAQRADLRIQSTYGNVHVRSIGQVLRYDRFDQPRRRVTHEFLKSSVGSILIICILSAFESRCLGSVERGVHGAQKWERNVRGEHSRVVIKFNGALKFARDGYPASGSVWGASWSIVSRSLLTPQGSSATSRAPLATIRSCLVLSCLAPFISLCSGML